MDRTARKLRFVAGTDWADARIVPLAGDASMRKYDRLHKADGRTAVLMDAPPDKGEDVRPFLVIARYLLGLGLSAPQILATDEAEGFLLIEDLGDALFARVVIERPALESTLYQAAGDALVTLHAGTPPEGLATYDPATMTRLSALSYSWYQSGARGTDPTGMEDFAKAFEPLLGQTTGTPDVVILRDYHAENLLWLPERDGVARVGQLDFQDAMLGHRAYDLVSLLQDARRDVPPALEEKMIARFIASSHADPDTFRRAYDVLSVQRNLRILGVFARLCMAYGRPHYVDLIPRVWAYLLRSLDRPALSDLRARLLHDLPAPTPETLDKLKEQCATRPLP
ncbi:aminoglycoside phosphotransferase [Pseudooceanicola sediminis]|uniref:Aminoglycoside phosphotransferase n=1 Tax=Pseudooceanicola sediminis TaxID=2211117 RepID=A0A399J700_9RHOB|nr:phosphotransferase [Pseudooceanicola sediminis]KAA2315465.1 phosphotransferase [Puniceibacterium sp. HSS470]RII40327.1 aminoglycoside phosphotransferase [Pseudooceanicola sediminis]|tara:strand:+ start:19706 stop:20725 length:1020 start_codon:yes stop_codon:yes gene_type:complete